MWLRAKEVTGRGAASKRVTGAAMEVRSTIEGQGEAKGVGRFWRKEWRGAVVRWKGQLEVVLEPTNVVGAERAGSPTDSLA